MYPITRFLRKTIGDPLLGTSTRLALKTALKERNQKLSLYLPYISPILPLLEKRIGAPKKVQ